MNNTRTWSILTAVLVLLIAAGGWFLLVSPKKTAAAALRQQTSVSDAAAVTLRGQIAALQQQNAGLPHQQELLRIFAAKMPPAVALPTLTRSILSAARMAKADLISLAPGVPVAPTPAPVVAAPLLATPGAGSSPTLAPSASAPAGGAPVGGVAAAPAPASAGQYVVVPLSISVAGSYFVLDKFFTALETLPRSLVVSALTVTPNAASTGVTNPPTLTVAVTASAYVAPSITPPVTAPTPAVTGSPSSLK